MITSGLFMSSPAATRPLKNNPGVIMQGQSHGYGHGRRIGNGIGIEIEPDAATVTGAVADTETATGAVAGAGTVPASRSSGLLGRRVAPGVPASPEQRSRAGVD